MLLQRFISTFPGRGPGIGLLLLRAAVGLSAVAEAQSMLRAGAGDGFSAGGIAVLLFAGSLSLLAGFMTPVSAIAVGLCGAGIGLDCIPSLAFTVIDDGLAIVLVVAVSLAIALLGPGAYSLDSYLFGRREIVIKRSSHAEY